MAITMLNELDILYTANTLVTKCSGGERKRLALALELTSIRMPNFICIDEPTSGLDSNSAEILVKCLGRMSHRHNITLVVAIHQPNINILKMFDQIYLLARGGVCIYSGTPDNIHEHIRFVTNHDDNDFPIEELIRYSCQNHHDQQVKRFVQVTNEKILNDDHEEKKLFNNTQLVPDGLSTNRTRFALNSIAILIQREFYFYRNHLWALILFFYTISLIVSINYRFLLNPKIAERNGCISFDDDFIETCDRSKDEKMELVLNYRYSYYIYSILIFYPIGISALLYHLELKYMINEHRNGNYMNSDYYFY
ncbi:hypothetical protein BLA29_007247 [Euroglyphus maynei]|uniref:ABC transporter domain-containing protein n=1 Tax=Euroglyphus maynei TaxID=6958 RepID=A0A1Y3BVM1_EURMA|nr:hypothetical protein BLA29_007247 [Euroglyphus maynei]